MVPNTLKSYHLMPLCFKGLNCSRRVLFHPQMLSLPQLICSRCLFHNTHQKWPHYLCLRNFDLKKNAKDQLERQKTNTSVLEKVTVKKHIEYNLAMKRGRLAHMLRNEVLVREITEGRMKGKSFWGRKILHMLT